MLTLHPILTLTPIPTLTLFLTRTRLSQVEGQWPLPGRGGQQQVGSCMRGEPEEPVPGVGVGEPYMEAPCLSISTPPPPLESLISP